MKKSEIYQTAMVSVVDDDRLDAKTKLEIIERLLSDKGIAELVEKKEAEKAAEDEVW